jgi:hypothetical protein
MSSSGSVAGSFTHAAVSAAPLLWFLEAGLHTVDPAERSQWELLWPVHSLNTKQSPAMVGCELNSVCTVCGLCPSPLSPWRFLATSLKGEGELRWQRAGFSHECVWDDLCRLLQRDEAIVLGIGYVRASLGHSGWLVMASSEQEGPLGYSTAPDCHAVGSRSGTSGLSYAALHKALNKVTFQTWPARASHLCSGTLSGRDRQTGEPQ